MKKYLSLFLALALGVSLVACTGAPADTAPSAAPTEEPTATAVATPTQEPTPTPEPTPLPTPEPPYHVDLSTAEFSTGAYQLMTIAEIPAEHEDVKKAFLSAGHSETDPVIFTLDSLESFVNDLNYETQPDFFDYNTTWQFTTETYCTGKTGGYVIVFDNTSGNFLVTGGAFGAGYKVKTTEFTMPDTDPTGYTFFQSPAGMYIADISLQRIYKPNMKGIKVSSDSIKIHDLTAEELKAGYTYDFTEGNVIDLKDTNNYFNIKKIPAEVDYATYLAIMNDANGFKDYAFYLEDNLAFYSARDLFEVGRTYRFTLRVYSEKPLTDGSDFSYCLQMANCPDYDTNGYQSQSSSTSHFVVHAVEGNEHLYDLVAEASVTDPEVNLIMLFSATEKVYVSCVTLADIGANG